MNKSILTLLAILFTTMPFAGCGPSNKEMANFDDCRDICRSSYPNQDRLYCTDTCMERRGF